MPALSIPVDDGVQRTFLTAGPADVLMGYLPDLDADVRAPLAAAGYGDELVARLGEGLDH